MCVQIVRDLSAHHQPPTALLGTVNLAQKPRTDAGSPSGCITHAFFLPVKTAPGHLANRAAEVRGPVVTGNERQVPFQAKQEYPHVNQEKRRASALFPPLRFQTNCFH